MILHLGSVWPSSPSDTPYKRQVFDAPRLAVCTLLAGAREPSGGVAARGEHPSEQRASWLGTHRLEPAA